MDLLLCFKIALLFCSFVENYPELYLNLLIFASNIWQLDVCFVFPPLLSGCRWKRGGNRQWWKGWLEINLLNRICISFRLSLILSWTSTSALWICALRAVRWRKFSLTCSLLVCIWDHFIGREKRSNNKINTCIISR